MPALPIRVYGDPVLHQPTLEVERFDAALRQLAERMIETMYAAPGVGLAANQVGVRQRMFVYDKGDGAHVVVNPRIVETSGEWTYEEGCLSVPGLSWPIVRPNRVHLVGVDLDGEPIDLEVDEYEGRILQHETDHLDGVVLVERLSDEPKREARRTLAERGSRPGRGGEGLDRLLER
ncbi:MAG TPA: peptide deformylase [Acidimicrobiales bacterium]|nr:peptide deformylase [Acidimicrobiales bacterium]